MRSQCTTSRFRAISVVFASLLWMASVGTVCAQQAKAEPTSSGFGGPTSVEGTLARDAEVEPTGLPSYFAFKDRLKDSTGLSYGLDYFALYQAASESPGENDAAGGVFRLFGSWNLAGRGSPNTGSLVFKIENRHKLWTDIAPQDLGSEVGYVGLTAVTFSNVNWILTNFYWEQQLLDTRLGFVAGYVDATDYVDVHGLVDPWSDFFNLSYSTDPTIPIPNQGLGAAIRFMATDRLYILGGLADANGDPSDPVDAWSSFFGTAEFFTHLEIGWISSLENRFTDNAHLTLWHADEREEADVLGGWGLAASWSQSVGERWIPFVRAGWSSDGGALLERSLSAGAGLSFRDGQDQLGVAIAWGRPNTGTFGPGLRDQITTEIFYRWRALRVFHLFPGVQFLFDPAQNPGEDLIVVGGIRARLSF